MDLRALRIAVTPIVFASLLALTASILLRLRGERGRRRQELVSSALGLAAVPALLAIGFVMPFITGTPIVHLLLPFLAPLLPMSVGYALIRHNVLATAAVLTRRMFVVPVLTGGLVAAIIAWLALRAVVSSTSSVALVPWAGAALALLALIALGARLSARLFFAATTRFRPTLQQLADDLASKGNVAEIGRSIQEAVMRWLPTEHAEVLAPSELDRLPHRPTGVNQRMDEGTVGVDHRAALAPPPAGADALAGRPARRAEAGAEARGARCTRARISSCSRRSPAWAPWRFTTPRCSRSSSRSGASRRRSRATTSASRSACWAPRCRTRSPTR